MPIALLKRSVVRTEHSSHFICSATRTAPTTSAATSIRCVGCALSSSAAPASSLFMATIRIDLFAGACVRVGGSRRTILKKIV
jgi:hypothetical protein